MAPPVQAEPVAAEPSAAADGGASMDELRLHAATIDDILKTASDRVERLAATEHASPRLMEAIRQELALSRRWNRHLETILHEVAEARRVLGERERQAAKEIARMTAVAEEARLELIELRKVLKQRPDAAAPQPEEHSEHRAPGDAPAAISHRMESDRRIASNPSEDGAVGVLAGPQGDLREARATLVSMHEAQRTAARDVDAVRAKIIDALQILADARGDLPLDPQADGGDLSSQDITAWAASMATRLARPSPRAAD